MKFARLLVLIFVLAPLVFVAPPDAASDGGSAAARVRTDGAPGFWWKLLAAALLLAPLAAAVEPLAGTRPLEAEGDLAEEMVAGLDRFLTLETEAAIGRRAWRWQRDFSS